MPDPRALLKQKDKEINLLHKIVHIIGSTSELNEILNQVVALVTEVTKADGCLLYVHEPKTNELVLRASKNPHPQILGRLRLQVGEGITGWVASVKKPVAISKNASDDGRFRFFHNLPEDRYEAFLSVPILMKVQEGSGACEEVVGVINAQHKKPRRHKESEISTLLTIGRLIGNAMENARLREDSEKKSHTIQSLEDDLRTRKVVEQAKGLLMRLQGLTEDEAFRKIQTQSMARRRPMREIAQAILLGDTIFFSGDTILNSGELSIVSPEKKKEAT